MLCADIDNDGLIAEDEMRTYLTSVFRVLFETQPGTRESSGMSAEELAAVTTAQCFADADLNGDGKLR
jgi:Ca2+-binding EF-hand superfamily protein